MLEDARLSVLIENLCVAAQIFKDLDISVCSELSHLTGCDGAVGSPYLHLLQQCCCRVVVLPGLDPPGRTGPAPPHSPAEEM